MVSVPALFLVVIGFALVEALLTGNAYPHALLAIVNGSHDTPLVLTARLLLTELTLYIL